jgi:hypothetical protein
MRPTSGPKRGALQSPTNLKQRRNLSPSFHCDAWSRGVLSPAAHKPYCRCMDASKSTDARTTSRASTSSGFIFKFKFTIMMLPRGCHCSGSHGGPGSNCRSEWTPTTTGEAAVWMSSSGSESVSSTSPLLQSLPLSSHLECQCQYPPTNALTVRCKMFKLCDLVRCCALLCTLLQWTRG